MEQVSWGQKVTQRLNAVVFYRINDVLISRILSGQLVILNPVFFQDFVGISDKLLGKIFVKDETKAIVTKLIGIHLAT
ncbi:Uncharacterised protein [Klebsiella pneumoniae]|nr:Uncharacterised protein [Klebsiella pneumoniae]